MPANQIIWNHFIFRFAKEQRPCHASYGNLITGLESDFEIIRIKRFLRSVVTLLCLSFFQLRIVQYIPLKIKHEENLIACLSSSRELIIFHTAKRLINHSPLRNTIIGIHIGLHNALATNTFSHHFASWLKPFNMNFKKLLQAFFFIIKKARFVRIMNVTENKPTAQRVRQNNVISYRNVALHVNTNRADKICVISVGQCSGSQHG